MNLKWVSIFFLILIYFQLMFETCPELSVEGNERHPCLILLLYSSHHRARSSVLDKHQQTMLSISSAGCSSPNQEAIISEEMMGMKVHQKESG